jgi:penicillin-insensitive murein endopeptidase
VDLDVPAITYLILRSAIRRVSKDAGWWCSRIATGAAMIAALTASALAAESPWGAVVAPSPGPTRVIGGPANGCIAGAAALPADGPGFSAIRVSRHRFYGHPDTIAFVERLGLAARAAGLAPFYVGDMAQPRGGPMNSGHGSHQNGMDVDIWFNLDAKPTLAVAAREIVDLPSMVLADKSAIDPKRFGARQVTLLRLAAGDARVDRIFVHPTIKRALCDGLAGPERGWLHKLRPWYGHDEHFHVRLSCPAGAPACVGQAPVPPGDGCDASLAWWLEPHPPAPKPAVPRPPKPKLPAQCAAVLEGR